jgi:hypothetical protein
MNDEASFQAHLRRLIFLALHWNHCLRFKRQRLAFACQKPYDLPLADPSFLSSPLIFFKNFHSLSFSLPLSLSVASKATEVAQSVVERRSALASVLRY